MKLEITGEERIDATRQRVWDALNDPDVLARCIPGCKRMTEVSPDRYDVEMELKVAAVRGGFEAEIALTDKQAPQTCRITMSGEGTLGTGSGTASFELIPDGEGVRLAYAGEGEVGGLVAGVGQRVLRTVSKHLIGKFFTALRKDFAAQDERLAS